MIVSRPNPFQASQKQSAINVPTDVGPLSVKLVRLNPYVDPTNSPIPTEIVTHVIQNRKPFPLKATPVSAPAAPTDICSVPGAGNVPRMFGSLKINLPAKNAVGRGIIGSDNALKNFPI